MKYTYSERVNYEIHRRNTRDEQKRFFKGAVNRMMYDGSAQEVIEDQKFACDVLCHTGFCLHVDCECCLLQQKFNEALKDFALGIR